MLLCRDTTVRRNKFLCSMLLRRKVMSADLFKREACAVYYGGAFRSWNATSGWPLGRKAGPRRTQDQLNRALRVSDPLSEVALPITCWPCKAINTVMLWDANLRLHPHRMHEMTPMARSTSGVCYLLKYFIKSIQSLECTLWVAENDYGALI